MAVINVPAPTQVPGATGALGQALLFAVQGAIRGQKGRSQLEDINKLTQFLQQQQGFSQFQQQLAAAEQGQQQGLAGQLPQGVAPPGFPAFQQQPQFPQLQSPLGQQLGISLLQQQAQTPLQQAQTGLAQARTATLGQPKPETVGQVRAQEIRRLQAIPAEQRTAQQQASLKTLLEGKAQVQVFTGAIGKTTATKIEKDVIDLQSTLGELGAIEQQFNPDFFTFRGKGKAFFAGLAERAEIPVGKAATEFLRDRSKFFADSKRVFLKFRKFITGVAGGIEEFREIAKATIDPEKDSPTQFTAKLDSMRNNAIRTSNLLLAIRNSGLQPNKTNIKAAISLTPLANIPLQVSPDVNLQTLGPQRQQQFTPEQIDTELRRRGVIK